MKSKLILMIFLLQFSFATFAQNTCQTSLSIYQGTQVLTFSNSNDLWLTFAADTFNYGFAIYPDTNLLYSNLSEMYIYSGDCDSLIFIRSIQVSNTDTLFVFLDSSANGSNYRINIQNTDSVQTGFIFNFQSSIIPKAVASGSTICNIIQNGEFNTNVSNTSMMHAFELGYVPHWNALIEDPSISVYPITQNPGGNAAYMFSVITPLGMLTEGISQTFAPISTNTNDYYRLSFRYMLPCVMTSGMPFIESLSFYLGNHYESDWLPSDGPIKPYYDVLVQTNKVQQIGFGSYTYPHFGCSTCDPSCINPANLAWYDQSIIFQIAGAPLNNQYDRLYVFLVAGNNIPIGINIDDVKLTKMNLNVTAASSSPVFCPNNSTPTTLSAISNSANPPINYIWDPGGLQGNPVLVSPSTTTTYTVTGIDNLGCWGTDQITLLNPFENLSINNPIIPCFQNSTVIQVHGAPFGATFNWNGFGGSNSSVSDPISSTGTYTVIVSYMGCDVTLTSVVTTASPSPNPVIDNFINNLCKISENNATFYELLQPINGNYLWELYESDGATYSNAGTLQSSTGTSNLITWDLNSFPLMPDFVILRITLNDDNGCISISDYKIFRCCEHPDPPDPLIKLNNTFASAENMQSTYNGVNFLINGEFVIDQDISFVNCTIHMGPESIIKILDNDASFISNEISGKICEFMWQGIESEKNEGKIREFNGNTILDAYNAISLTGDLTNSANPAISIYNNDFINNNQGIVLSNFSNKPASCYTIYKNEFYSQYSSSNPNPNVTFLPPLNQPYKKPYSGINVTYCNNMTIGKSGNYLDQNIFYYLFSGIRCVNSDVKVVNNAFNYIREVFDPNGMSIITDIKGMAIYSARTPNFSANFSQQGIIVGGSSPEANYIRNVDIGIYAKNNKHFTISYNVFSIVKHGIYALGSQSFKITHKLITKNTFTNISRNGICLTSLSGVVVYDNIINHILPPPNLATTSKVFGIRARACNATAIVKNNIYNSNITSDYRIIGISCETGPNTIKNNTITNLGDAANFNGNCLPSTFACNTMTNDFYGLYMKNSTIGPQGGPNNPSCNKWFGTFTLCQTFLDAGTSAPSNPYYCRSNGNEYPTFLCPNLTSLSRIITTGFCTLCIDDYFDPEIDAGTIAFPLKSSILWVLQDSVQYPTSDEKQFWLGKFNLYSTLSAANPDSLSADMLEFMASYESNNINIFTIAAMVDSGQYKEAIDLFSTTSSLSDASFILLQTYNIMSEAALTGNFANGEPIYNQAQLVKLREYASLCPYEYGYGVYLARNLLSRIEPNIYYHNCDDIIDMRSMEKPAINDELKVNVYPNPAKDEFTVELLGDIAGQSVSIEMFDLYGSLVKTLKLDNDNIIEISTSSLSAGVYFYRVKVDQNILDENKLVIIK